MAIYDTYPLIFAGAGLIAYLYFAFALFTIANKTNTANAWLAFIPFGNIYIMTKIAGKEWWWALIVIFAGIIPVIGSLISFGAMVYLILNITKVRNKPTWVAILSVIPVLNIIGIAILAWSD